MILRKSLRFNKADRRFVRASEWPEQDAIKRSSKLIYQHRYARLQKRNQALKRSVTSHKYIAELIK